MRGSGGTAWRTPLLRGVYQPLLVVNARGNRRSLVRLGGDCHRSYRPQSRKQQHRVLQRLRSLDPQPSLTYAQPREFDRPDGNGWAWKPQASRSRRPPPQESHVRCRLPARRAETIRHGRRRRRSDAWHHPRTVLRHRRRGQAGRDCRLGGEPLDRSSHDSADRSRPPGNGSRGRCTGARCGGPPTIAPPGGRPL